MSARYTIKKNGARLPSGEFESAREAAAYFCAITGYDNFARVLKYVQGRVVPSLPNFTFIKGHTCFVITGAKA